VKIVYTKHALKKFKDLAELKILISRSIVNSIIKEPISIDNFSDFPNKIATGMFDKTHVLRIVYKEEDGKIVIVTFYPGKKERYI